MTIAVDLGREAKKQTNKHFSDCRCRGLLQAKSVTERSCLSHKLCRVSALAFGTSLANSVESDLRCTSRVYSD